MPEPKTTLQDGKPIHYSVGALIERGGKYLLIFRAQDPKCYAGVAGHVDEGEEPTDAIRREVNEESGLQLTESKLLFEEFVDWNWCRRGVTGHYWRLYACQVTGEVQLNASETKSIDWYTPQQIRDLDFEPVWKYWFEKLSIL
jgi:ADP-ribose pyrophosphatase YjhB (NUDIX family)